MDLTQPARHLPEGATAALDDVIITGELARRPARAPNIQAENRALYALARRFTGTPRELLDSLVGVARDVCQAGSAGVGALATLPSGAQIIRWEAVAGVWAGYAGRSKLAHLSPSGATLARSKPQLYSYPARYFTYLDELSPPMVEGLFIPFSTADKTLGTIWIGSHDEGRKFDAEDVRILTGLAGFSAAALQMMQLVETQRGQVTSAREETDLHTQLNAALRDSGERGDELRREAEERVAVLEELDRLKDDLLAIASHDLKGPLTSIKGHAQLLLRNLDTPNSSPEQLRLGLTTINTQTAQMTRMLDHLLGAARIHAGAYQPRLAPCDFKDCLETVLRELKPEESARIDVELKTALSTGNWEQEMIEQLLANLVGNALKYSPEGQRVWVEVEQRGGNIAVAVSDKGVGIPAGELPGLFERFHRTPQAQASGLPGTGLGLFICRGIVEAHGGRIWVESPGEGQGSTFRFTLPNRSLKGGQPGERER